MLGREGVNTLSMGDGTGGAVINGSVTFTGGADIDRVFFDSGSKVGGNMNLTLGNGDNQVFGDSLGLGAGPLNPTGTGKVGGTLTLTPIAPDGKTTGTNITRSLVAAATDNAPKRAVKKALAKKPAAKKPASKKTQKKRLRAK